MAKGDISFFYSLKHVIEEGKWINVNEEDYTKYGIHPKMHVNSNEENKPYFKWHKRYVFKG